VRYVIDGYNLIGSSHMFSLSDPKKESRLAEWLGRHLGKTDKAEVIFDGHHLSYEYGSTQIVGGIKLVFTAIGETADAYIQRRYRGHGSSGICLVSSDRELIRFSKQFGLQSLSSEGFFKKKVAENRLQASAQEKPIPNDGDADFWLNRFLPK